MNEVYRLRYKVYCEEWGFERPEDHPGGVEIDRYDAHSVHIGALLKETGELIGTIRIILNSELGFPIESHCTIDADISRLDRDKIGEISRLAVSKDYRRRVVDKLIYNDGESYQGEIIQLIDERRANEFLIIMGLYICMYKESVALGLTNWYALMARGLYTLLKRMNIVFKPIGMAFDYHGLRTPYIGSIIEIIDKVSSGKAEIFEEYEKAIVNG